MKPSAKAIDESLARRGRRLHRTGCGSVAAGRRRTRRGGVDADARGTCAILFRAVRQLRRRTSRVRYVDAIEARGIPHLLVGGKSFHGREEVETIRAALAAIEWPDDELSVFATLKARCSRSTTRSLLEYRHRLRIQGRAFHPFRVPKELGRNSGQDLALTRRANRHLTPIADALRLLAATAPAAGTIGRLPTRSDGCSTATRAHVGFILRPAGEQALANVLHVAELARAVRSRRRHLVPRLHRRTAARRSGSEAAEAPIRRRGQRRRPADDRAQGEEARVPRRHSRGPDVPDEPRRRQPLHAMHRAISARSRLGGWAPRRSLRSRSGRSGARSGGRRAAGIRRCHPRARSAVVPALGDEPWDGGWFESAQSCVVSVASRSGDQALAGRSVRCSESKDTVLQRPNDEPAGPCNRLSWSAYPFDDYSVVWWDPGALDLGKKPAFGVRREDLIVKDVPKNVIADGRSRYDRWLLNRAPTHANREACRRCASKPSTKCSKARIRLQTSNFRLQTSHFRLWICATLQPAIVPPALRLVCLCTSYWLRRRSMQLPRIWWTWRAFTRVSWRCRTTTPLRAARAVHRVLQHRPPSTRAAADVRGACRRETPVTTTEAGVLVEGVVDLAFEEDGQWTVVDYKTDRELLTIGEDRYRRQVATYALAIREATGQPVSGVLMRL